MSNRINLDDPNYDQNQNRVTVQDNKAKMLWAVLGVIAVIVIIFVITLQSGNNGSGKSESVSQNPHDSCQYFGKDREYFAGPMVDIYYNSEHPEWGMHTH